MCPKPTFGIGTPTVDMARDLKLLKVTDYAELARQTTEVKRMLTGLIQKLTADR
jgi:hypothetical protein